MKGIVLASSSPRRSELLQKHDIAHIIEYDTIEEVLDTSLTISKRLEKLAIDKGKRIASTHPSSIVISADTMVCLDGNMLGKAKGRNVAKKMLQAQSGKSQEVYTAIAIFENGEVVTYCDITTVVFKKLHDNEIEEYLDSDEWIGKAGAYAIQGEGSRLIHTIDGDIETVIGLPVRIIKDYLNNNNT